MAAIEAGLGGRLDATNTIPSRVTVLTSIGLDHTEWLGETELEIAAEKLAVLRDQTTLVLGRVSAEVRGAGRARPRRERGARLVGRRRGPGAGGAPARRRASFQRRNFALARAAAEAFLGDARPRAGRARWRRRVTVPGRLERIAEQPPTYLDAAHNPDGAAALAEALPALAGGRRVVACLAILADKDAAAMVAALAPALDRAVCTELPAGGAGRPRPARRPLAPGRRSWRRPARRPACRPRPSRTSRRRCGARRRSPPSRPRASCWSPAPTMQSPRARRARSRRPDCARIRGMDRPRSAGSELLSMMGLVAAVVAIVILVFFGVGYLFGRLFL